MYWFHVFLSYVLVFLNCWRLFPFGTDLQSGLGIILSYHIYREYDFLHFHVVILNSRY